MTTDSGLTAAARGVLLRSILAGRQAADPPSRPRHDSGPATFAQEQLWFLDQLMPDTPNYNVPFAFTLDGPLDAQALAQALRELVRRHDALRTVLRLEPGGLTQQVRPDAEFRLPVRDLCSAADPAAEGWRICRQLVSRPFRLTEPPLWRAELLRLAPDGSQHLLVWVASHAVADGWSIGLLLRELSTLYSWARSGQRSPLPPAPRMQLIDYARWQRDELTESRLRELFDYWSQQLSGAAELNFPYDHPRPALPSAAGRTAAFAFSSDLMQSLTDRARALRQTPFTLALAAYISLLIRYCGHSDISVGIPVAGRERPEHDDLMGSLVNTLVIRVNPAGDVSFAELLDQVAEACRGAFEHSALPFGKLVERLRPARPGGQTPLCDTVFSFGSTPFAGAEHRLDDVRLGFRGVSNDTVRFDFELALDEQDGAWSGRLEYSVDLFEPDSAALLCQRYLHTLRAALADPDRRLSELLPAGDHQSQPRSGGWSADPLQACAEQLAPELGLVGAELIGWAGEPDGLGYRLASQLAATSGAALYAPQDGDTARAPDCWVVSEHRLPDPRPPSKAAVVLTDHPAAIRQAWEVASRCWLVRLRDGTGLALINELVTPEDGQVLGRPAAGTVVEVVDEQGRPALDRMVGRLRVRAVTGASWSEPGWRVHRLADGRLATVARTAEVTGSASPSRPGEQGARASIELRLAQLWNQALEREDIGRDEDFFTAGGHSVLGAQLVARIRAELQCDISLLDFFGAPSIAELAELIEQRSAVEPELPPELLDQVAQLSDEEVKQMLDQLGGS